MSTRPASDRPKPKAPEPKRVLLVANSSPESLEWARADGSNFDVETASSVERAAERLSVRPIDVVILDARLAEVQASQLPRLLQRLGTAALLVRADGFGPETPSVMQQLGAATCLLPAAAPATVQAQVVTLAADRARLLAELTQRVAELERSNLRFRDVIERNADAILVVDREGVIRFANATAAALFRDQGEELIGTLFGFPVVAGETTELDLLHPGQVRAIEMRVVESEWEGKFAYIATLRDITERKRIEEAARRLIKEQAGRTAAEAAARRFRFQAEATTLLSHSLDYPSTLATLTRLCVQEVADWAVVYVMNEHGAVQRLEVAHRDPAKADVVAALREQPFDPSSAHPVLEVLRTRSPLLVTDVDDERLKGMARDEPHLQLLRELGVASFMFVPLVAHGRELGAIGVVSSDPGRRFNDEDLAQANDLALRAALAIDNARLYDEAQKANQAKTNLLAVISHDLRTPLNSIIGHTELLAMGIPDQLSEAGLQRVDRIRVGATHLIYLIDQLLSFARLEAGSEELHFQDVRADAIAREVAAVVEPLALDRALAFHLDLPEGTPLRLRTDPDRLRQVLLNLVGNAVKYTQRGEVRLVLRPLEEGGVLFQVEDSGIGIRPEHLEKIFDPFWQVDPTQRASYGGTGLGLSVVRRVLRMLGGDVTVESCLGQGSTFAVRLPSQTVD